MAAGTAQISAAKQCESHTAVRHLLGYAWQRCLKEQSLKTKWIVARVYTVDRPLKDSGGDATNDQPESIFSLHAHKSKFLGRKAKQPSRKDGEKQAQDVADPVPMQSL